MKRLISIVLVCLLHLSLAVASTYNLRVEVTPGGAGTLNTNGGTHEEGSSIYLRTYGNTGYVFKGWYKGDDLVSSSASFNYTMPAEDVVMQARYAYDPSVPADPAMPDTTKRYSLSVGISPNGAGSLNSSGGKYAKGTSVSLRAYANTGYQFTGWTDETGETLSNSASYTYLMPGRDVRLTANYYYDPSVPANPDSMATRYTVEVKCRPVGGGSFNTSSSTASEGSSVHLYSYTNTGYLFKHWEDSEGKVLSSDQNFYYTIPHGNSVVYGVFEYDPPVPANPAKNYWNKELGEVIVDDFTVGRLGDAVSSVIGNSSRDDVAMLTVAGKMNDNDFGIANNYTKCTLLDLSRVTGITSVPSYAFDYTQLESVYLPATIEKIGYRAFYECKQLSSLTLYAMVPPAVENYAFTGIPEGLVVYVPASSLSQYQEAEGWKNFTFLPIQEDIRSLTVALPEGTDASVYGQMWLELTNRKSGQRMHFVMTDRASYTFANIIRNTSWNAVVRNQRGDVFGKIDGIDVGEEDVNVAFESLQVPQNVTLTIKDAAGNDVTGNTQITWTDADGNYLAQAAAVNGLLPGNKIGCQIVLSQNLAMAYAVPSLMEHTVAESGNELVCTLSPLQKVVVSGKVMDLATKAALSGAVVSASQTFGGKYSKTTNVKTDSKGQYSIEIFRVPTSLAIAASDYISQTLECDVVNAEGDNVSVSDVSLKSITGAVVTLGFTYTKCPDNVGEEGDVQSFYGDYNNVDYALYNKTRNRAIGQFKVQYPQIVLLEEVNENDELEITASSRTSAFLPVKATAKIDAQQRADVTFDILELGTLKSSFTANGNASVVGSLYDANGKLLKTYDYSNGSLTVSNLADGSYTLVTMGSSRLFNTIYDLSQLPQTGLAKDVDYVQNNVKIESGKLSVVSIAEVPTLDESKLYYTGDNTSFTVNKSSIVAGNYLTLTGHLDFKSAYSTKVSNVNLIVDLPESCSFVENSVMVGNSTSSYTLEGNRVTIPMARYTDRVRFCIIPTLGGEYAPSALAQFDLEGKTITQPIGSANYTAEDLSIKVPSTVAKTTIPVSGTAIGASDIEIYDNDVLIGQTRSLANGTWATTCELNEPYNLSTHSIYAKVITKNGLELLSEMVSCMYDRNSIEVKKVTMINTAHPASSLNTCEYVTVFDFQNPSNTIPAYWYWPNYPDFTFLIDFTNNDSTIVSNVTLHVKLSNNTIVRLKPIYEKSKDLWVVSNKFYSNALPKNVSVTYDISGEIIVDRSEIEVKNQNIDGIKNHYNDLTNCLNDSIDAISKQEVDGKAMLSKLDSISIALSQATNEIKERELWEQYFNLTGHEELLDSMVADCPEVITPEYQQDLLDRIDKLLLNDIIVPDEAEWISFVQGVDELLNDSNNVVDFEASVATLYDTEYKWDNNGIERIMQKIPIAEIDLKQFDEAELTTVNTSDSNQLLLGVNERMMVWVDTSCDSAWVIKDSQLVSELRGIIDSAKNNPDMLLTIADGIKYTWMRVMDILSYWKDKTIKQYNNLQAEIDACEHYKRILDQRGLECQREIARIQKELNNMTRSVPVVEDYFTSNQRKLKGRLEVLRKSYQEFTKQGQEAAAKQAKLKIKWAKCAAVLGTITDVFDLSSNIYQLISQIIDGKRDWDKWCKFINTILPCDASESQAISIKKASEDNRNIILAKYIGCGTATAAALGGTIYLMTNKAAGVVVKLVFGSISDLLSTYSNKFFCSIKKDSAQKLSNRKKERQRLKCSDNDDDNKDDYNDDANCGNDDGNSGNGDVGHVMDPSGYVYEGVSSNRLEGVTATAYYKETVEDMYGDKHENVVKWDAEEYAQENPLFTDENGMYAWDVPQGLWQVKFEKEGYETTYSEWLPVPPPQLDINIAMTQNVQPNVKSARAFEDAVEMEFDKYMIPELLTADNIRVVAGDATVEGTIELLNEEESYEGNEEKFASKVRFNAAAPFDATEITLQVSNRVKSYAGIRMQDDYLQTFTIEQEIRKIVCDSATVVGYGEPGIITVSVLPASASAGKTILVRNSSTMILGTEVSRVVLDEKGEAVIPVSGELPGTAALTFTIEGYDLSATTIVNVEQIDHTEVSAPVASIASGTTVEKGTKVALSSSTEGATIYYSLDGSCPCDEATRLVYTDSIVINQSVTILAMAVASDMTESDIVEFTYIVEEGVGNEEVSLEEDLEIYPLPVHDKLNISANGKMIKRVTLISLEGATTVTATKPATYVSIDVSALNAGIYVIHIATEDKTYSRKIRKVE